MAYTSEVAEATKDILFETLNKYNTSLGNKIGEVQLGTAIYKSLWGVSVGYVFVDTYLTMKRKSKEEYTYFTNTILQNLSSKLTNNDIVYICGEQYRKMEKK